MLWENVLIFNEDVSYEVPDMTERGIVYCLECKKENVHICIEDKPVVLYRPASTNYVKMVLTKRGKKRFHNYISIINYRKKQEQ